MSCSCTPCLCYDREKKEADYLKKRVIYRFRFLLLFLLVSLLVATVVFLIWNNYSFYDLKNLVLTGKAEGKGISHFIQLPMEKTILLGTSDSYIYVYADRTLTVYDSQGREANMVPVLYGTPTLVSFPWGAVIYDRGKDQVTFFVGSEKKSEQSIQGEILAVTGGYDRVLFITGPKEGYLGSVVVTDTNGSVIATTSYANRFPVSAAVIDKGRRYVISGIDFIQVDKTFLDIYRMYAVVPEAGMEVPKLSPLVMYLDKNGFAAVGTAGVFLYDNSGQLIRQIEVQDARQVLSDGKSLLYVLHRQEGDPALMRISGHAGIEWDRLLSFDPDGMDSREGQVVLWSGTTIQIMENRRAQDKMILDLSGIRKVYLMTDRKLVILTTDGLVLYNF